MTIQTETEDQATQDNTIHTYTHSDTTRHPMAYPDTETDFEHDPELDSEDQNILAIESTDTLDNPIDNDPIQIKDNILSVVDNNTQDFNSPIDFNNHNNSMATQAKTNNSDLTFDNVHNSSVSDCTDIKQTIDNSDIGDPNESKTETIDDNMQDQTSNTDNEDQDNSEFESTGIVHIGTKDESDPKCFKSGTNLGYFSQEAMRLQYKQEIRSNDFGPNLRTQASECADINAIRSRSLTPFNCKSPDHLTKDCREITKCNNLKATINKIT